MLTCDLVISTVGGEDEIMGFRQWLAVFQNLCHGNVCPFSYTRPALEAVVLGDLFLLRHCS